MAAAIWTLGVDPGRSGAAVLLRGRSVAAAASWKTSKAGGALHYKMRIWVDRLGHRGGFRARADSPLQIGNVLAQQFRVVSQSTWDLRVEDVYVRQNVKTTVSMARWAGAMSAPLAEYSLDEIGWVKATEWRKTLLNMSPWTKRDRAKKAANDYVPLLLDGENYGPAAEYLGSADFVDAVGIALSNVTPKEWPGGLPYK